LISFNLTEEQSAYYSLVAVGGPARASEGEGEWHMETGWFGGPPLQKVFS